ncbi:hypothetical protein [Caldisalinibacter kiritimatiensis]|uniref:STAS/SEC14 domain-containing protein n=1 Tax=Caldisalinibacter kiritimatiensis TaxID=1304284 RepID=R1AY68_9FIRM|nr:hypothetical protein [Caldisalinibacter kiritimatiensis]EOD01617.1 hypothetical protein L21TH_0309 [Caldisalinibacter kiritimatiensis]
MEIKDLHGKYFLKVDLERNLVYEKPIGYWTSEDVKRLHNDYVEKIVPLFNGEEWAKLCDLSAYKVSMITEDIQDHVEWGWKNAFTTAATVLDKYDNYRSVIELQMKIAAKDKSFKQEFFYKIENAEKWLKTQGF